MLARLASRSTCCWAWLLRATHLRGGWLLRWPALTGVACFELVQLIISRGCYNKSVTTTAFVKLVLPLGGGREHCEPVFSSLPDMHELPKMRFMVQRGTCCYTAPPYIVQHTLALCCLQQN